jgi:hypothetical protein
MLWGFLQVGATGASALIALAVGAGIPAVAGISLLRDPRRRQLDHRKAELRRQTIESEILRLADASGGKLTTVEVVRELAVDAVEAGDILDSMARRDLAEILVSDSGVLVYDFRDLRHLGEKDSASGLLDG